MWFRGMKHWRRNKIRNMMIVEDATAQEPARKNLEFDN
jgi:hypothetical protein